jgi:flagellar export protein FliJ
MRFIFDLEPVLKHRLAIERQHQLAVATLERERSVLEEEVRGYQCDIVREKQDLREQLDSAATLDLRGVRFQAGASLRLITLAQRAVVRLAGLHKRIDAARLDLLQAAMRRKAVETLKERRSEEWKHEQKRRESAAADELNVMHAARPEADL